MTIKTLGLTKADIKKLINRFVCAECGGRLTQYFDLDSHTKYLACADNQDHRGTAKPYRSPPTLNIESMREELNEMTTEKANKLAIYAGQQELQRKQAREIVESLKIFFKKSYNVIDIDGIRVDFPDGWGLVRPSNTQPALVLRFEAKTKERLEEIQKLICDKLEEIKDKA